jgi:hypothetical protein
MNSHGGTLLVGVRDDGSVLGLEEDFTVFSKKDTDGWEQWLTQLLINHFGKPVTTNVTVKFGAVDDRTVARIDVAPSPEPAYTQLTRTGAKGESFLVRINNTTQELRGSQAATYQHKRWAG